MSEPHDGLKALVLEAMARGLDEKKREELIKGALAHLLEKSTDRYGGVWGGKTKLEDAWFSAVHHIACEVVRERVENDPEIRSRINDLFTKAMQKVFESEGLDKLINSIADGIRSALAMEK